MKTPEAPARARVNESPAGSEASALTGTSQQNFPTHDTPASHLRNALQILALAQIRPGHPALGDLASLKTSEFKTWHRDVTTHVTAALDGIAGAEAAEITNLRQARDDAWDRLAVLTEADVSLLADVAMVLGTPARVDDLRKRLADVVRHASGSRAPADRTPEMNGTHASTAGELAVDLAEIDQYNRELAELDADPREG